MLSTWLDSFISRRRLVPGRNNRFRCNVCGAQAQCAAEEFGRETSSCNACKSTVRMRSIVHHVSMAIFGKSIALPEFPHRPDIRGVGLSDWDEYARRLAERVSYTNTYYHQEPFLDVTNVPDASAGSCDFVVSTDVFEHVAPPVSRAFDGALKLLKPGGTLVLTVPFATEITETREHFPRLGRFEIVEPTSGHYRLINTRDDDVVEHFDDLIFHGGPGTTLEMRVFARASLEAELKRAGFTNIRFDDTPVPRFGIYWLYPWSVPIIAQAPMAQRSS
jgi:SAM-dependent methyltransferase